VTSSSDELGDLDKQSKFTKAQIVTPAGLRVLQDGIDDGDEVAQALPRPGASGQDIVRTRLSSIDRLLLMPVEPQRSRGASCPFSEKILAHSGWSLPDFTSSSTV